MFIYECALFCSQLSLSVKSGRLVAFQSHHCLSVKKKLSYFSFLFVSPVAKVVLLFQSLCPVIKWLKQNRRLYGVLRLIDSHTATVISSLKTNRASKVTSCCNYNYTKTWPCLNTNRPLRLLSTSFAVCQRMVRIKTAQCLCALLFFSRWRKLYVLCYSTDDIGMSVSQ